MPLPVWSNKGFDAEAIAEKSDPVDIRDHTVLGSTYRVRIESKVTTETTLYNRIKRTRCNQGRQPASSSGANMPAASSGVVPKGSNDHVNAGTPSALGIATLILRRPWRQ